MSKGLQKFKDTLPDFMQGNKVLEEEFDRCWAEAIKSKGILCGYPFSEPECLGCSYYDICKVKK